jgi:hypothetical protein
MAKAEKEAVSEFFLGCRKEVKVKKILFILFLSY